MNLQEKIGDLERTLAWLREIAEKAKSAQLTAGFVVAEIVNTDGDGDDTESLSTAEWAVVPEELGTEVGLRICGSTVTFSKGSLTGKPEWVLERPPYFWAETPEEAVVSFLAKEGEIRGRGRM